MGLVYRSTGGLFPGRRMLSRNGYRSRLGNYLGDLYIAFSSTRPPPSADLRGGPPPSASVSRFAHLSPYAPLFFFLRVRFPPIRPPSHRLPHLFPLRVGRHTRAFGRLLTPPMPPICAPPPRSHLFVLMRLYAGYTHPARPSRANPGLRGCAPYASVSLQTRPFAFFRFCR